MRQFPKLGLLVHHIQHIGVNVNLFHPEWIQTLDGVKFAFGSFEICIISMNSQI